MKCAMKGIFLILKIIKVNLQQLIIECEMKASEYVNFFETYLDESEINKIE